MEYINGNRVTVDERVVSVSSEAGKVLETPNQQSDYGFLIRVLNGNVEPGLQALARSRCGEAPFYVLVAETKGPSCRTAVFIVDANTFEVQTVLLNPTGPESSRFDLVWNAEGARP